MAALNVYRIIFRFQEWISEQTKNAVGFVKARTSAKSFGFFLLSANREDRFYVTVAALHL